MDKSERYTEKFFNSLGYIALHNGASDESNFWIQKPDKFLSPNIHTSEILFLCVVKEISDGVSSDSIEKLLTRNVQEAYLQFKNSNKEHFSLPTVFFVFNEKEEATIRDFLTLSGNTKEKKYIDACIWYNEKEKDLKIAYNKDSNKSYEIKEWLKELELEAFYY